MVLTNVRAVVGPGASLFELAIATEIFGIDRRDTGGPAFDFAVVTARPGTVPTEAGFDIAIDRGLEELAGADAVVVAPFALPEEDEADVFAALRAAHERGARIVSLCSAAFVLARAGLLDGRRATTHWLHTRRLAQEHPAIEVDPGVLYVSDGRVLTSAGTAAGIDACLHLVREELGAEAATAIARRMVVPPHRDGGQAQYIDHAVPECSSEGLATLLEWAGAHPAHDLSVEALARRSHQSPRTFARRFRAETGTTPAAWVARMRLALAQQLLETSGLGMEEVAREVGFSDAAVLRQHFTRVLGTSPRAYRARFRAA